jgi:hypothetical protein
MTEKTFFVRDYWPNPEYGKINAFVYKAVDGSMKDLVAYFLLSEDKKDLLYVDYNSAMEWQDTWYMRHIPGKGLMEWRDDYPKGGVFGTRKKVVMDPPIGWGEWGTIGSFYQNFPKMDPLSCNPPQFSTGTQTVIWESWLPEMTLSNEDKYTDIITMVYQQSWGKKTSGARYYMAKGIGPIAVQWIAPHPNKPGQFVTTARMDAKYTVINGYQKDIQS